MAWFMALTAFDDYDKNKGLLSFYCFIFLYKDARLVELVDTLA